MQTPHGETQSLESIPEPPYWRSPPQHTPGYVSLKSKVGNSTCMHIIHCLHLIWLLYLHTVYTAFICISNLWWGSWQGRHWHHQSDLQTSYEPSRAVYSPFHWQLKIVLSSEYNPAFRMYDKVRRKKLMTQHFTRYFKSLPINNLFHYQSLPLLMPLTWGRSVGLPYTSSLLIVWHKKLNVVADKPRLII